MENSDSFAKMENTNWVCGVNDVYGVDVRIDSLNACKTYARTVMETPSGWVDVNINFENMTVTDVQTGKVYPAFIVTEHSSLVVRVQAQ